MSLLSIPTFRERTYDYRDISAEAGFFTVLNLNYESTVYEVKRNADQFSKELKIDLQSYEELFGADNYDKSCLKAEYESRKQLLDKIEQACRILSNDELRDSYLHDIKTRCLLSQALTTTDLKERFSGRLFPFFVFEVYKKNGGLFNETSHRFLYLNFVEMIVEEKKDGQLIRAFNCSSITQIVPAFKADELYLTFMDGNNAITYHYNTKHLQQRDLLIDLILFAKHLATKRSAQRSEKMKNPNANEHYISRCPKDMVNSTFGGESNPCATFMPFKLLTSDRIIPPKFLLQCEVSKKGLFEKKIWLTIGTSNIIISQDKEMKHLIQLFPICSKSISILKKSEKGDIVITSGETKHCFHTSKPTEANTVLNLVTKILSGESDYDQVISTYPHNKMDMNVKTVLKKRLLKVNKQILAAKKLIKDLKAKKTEIKSMLVNEKQKGRTDTLPFVDSRSMILPSKTSVSYDENIPKSQMSLYTLDELKEESISLSQTSISLSPIKYEKAEATEPIQRLFSFRRGSLNINEIFNQQQGSSTPPPVREKNPRSNTKIGQDKGGRSQSRTKSGSKILSKTNSQELDKDFTNRGGIRNFTATLQVEEKIPLKQRALPMSMNALVKGDDEQTPSITNFADFLDGRNRTNLRTDSILDRPSKGLYRNSFSHNLPDKFDIKRQKLCF